MKTTLKSMVKQTFQGKRFLASDSHNSGDMVYDIYQQDVCVVDELIGKTIVWAEVVHLCEDDVGLAFTFDDCSNPVFFRSNCNITVED